MGNTSNSDARPQFRQNGGNNYRSNDGNRSNGGNNYKSNGGFKGKNFNVGSSSFSSSNSRHNGSGTWSGNTKNRFNVVIECQICKKRGHTTVNCFHKNSNSSSTCYMLKCQIYENRRHSALECYHMGNYALQGQPPPLSLNAMAA